MRQNVNLKHVVSFVISQWLRNTFALVNPHKCSYRLEGCSVRNTLLSEVTLGILLYSFPCEEDFWPLAHHELFRATNMQIVLKLRGQSLSVTVYDVKSLWASESIPVGYDQLIGSYGTHPIQSQWSRPGMCNEWLCGHLFLSQWTTSQPPPPLAKWINAAV